MSESLWDRLLNSIAFLNLGSVLVPLVSSVKKVNSMSKTNLIIIIIVVVVIIIIIIAQP